MTMRPLTPRIQEMMRVYAPDGRLEGIVSAVGPTHFEVSMTRHPLRFYDVPMGDVREVRSRARVVLRRPLGRSDRIPEDPGSAEPVA